jgi:hypothetical protein
MSDRYPCPSCGADLNWSPGDGDLNCPYCAHTGPAPDVEGAAAAAAAAPSVVEHDLDAVLDGALRGWGSEVRQHRCSACSAVTAMPPEVIATSCPFCGTTKIEDQPVDESVLRPESLLPFAVDERTAIAGFRKWVSGLWFRPATLKSMSRLERISGVYVPVWTFDTDTTSHWNADAGYHYYEEEHTTNAQGKATTRKVKKTRWEPASGTVHAQYDDWLVQASAGLDQDLFKGLEPFDTSMLRPYESKYLAGFLAERYQISLKAGWGVAQGEISSDLRAKCRSKVPGDTGRNLNLSTQWRDTTFKHCLLPVWIAAYQYNGKAYRYVVNGVTGKMHGTAPLSWLKIIGCAVLVVGTLAVIAVGVHLASR